MIAYVENSARPVTWARDNGTVKAVPLFCGYGTVSNGFGTHEDSGY